MPEITELTDGDINIHYADILILVLDYIVHPDNEPPLMAKDRAEMKTRFINTFKD